MKKKITALLVIFILIFTNYAFAYNETSGYTARYTRVTGGADEKKLKDIKDENGKNIIIEKNEETRVDARYTAVASTMSQSYDNYDYNSDESCAKINIAQNKPKYYDAVNYNYKTSNKCYIKEIDGGKDKNGVQFIDRYLTIKLPASKNTITFDDNELYIIYKNGVKYDDKAYDIKLQVNSIRGELKSECEFCFHVGRYKKLENNNYERIGFFPGVGVVGDMGKAEVDVSYTVLDSTGKQTPVTGIFVISDIDLNQGIALNNIDITKQKVFMNKDSSTGDYSDKIDYLQKTSNGNTTSYIYSTTEDNLSGNHMNAYVSMGNYSQIDLTFTFEQSAFSTIGYEDFNNYYKIETNVHYGTITDSMYDVNQNDNKTISYQPKQNYYLKEIKVDGKKETLSDSIQNSYTFSKIDSDHEIEVTYAPKLKVEFNSNGGTSVKTQYVIPKEKATEPAHPTKNGFTFKGWYIDKNCTTPYNFANEVNEDKILYAKWEEVKPEEITHNITYVIKGTPSDNNAKNNPKQYKEGNTTPLTISNPTLEGYTFSGWFEKEDLTGNPISSLSVAGKTEDITLYGKWNKDPEPEPEEKTAQYKVNHYLEDENGTKEYNGKKYKLDETNSTTKTGTVGTTVTERARNYAGYNKTKDSVQATILEDGSTTLDLYYNKINYTIVFDSKGGTKVDTQTKNYEEKVDEPKEPTKDGYEFLYWYEEKDGEKVIYDFDTPVTSDKKLIAEWEEIKIIPDQQEDTDVPEQENKEVPTQKTDTTVAKKIIPNTGIGTAILGTIVIIVCAFFGIRFFKLRKDMK